MAIDKKVQPHIFSLNKCNPRLSGNIKFVCDDDKIYIESIDSNAELFRNLYKAYKVNTASNLMANAKNFFDLFTVKDEIFTVKEDNNNVVTDFSLQHERLYNYGAYSDTSEMIQKSFRFFAPLFMNKNASRPDAFVVYKVNRGDLKDGKPYLNEMVHMHDLRRSEMGKQLNRHIEYQKDAIDDIGIFVNFGDNTAYTGTSLDSGLIETRYEDNFENVLANERTLTEYNSSIVDGYRKHGLIDSRYLNLEFCFDLDLTNGDMTDTFVDVIGFYANIDEFGNISEYNDSNADFKLLENNTEITKVTDTITEDDLKDNLVVVNSASAIQFTSDNFVGNFAPLVMIEPKFIPNVGDKIVLSYNGNTEISYFVTPNDIVSNSIIDTAKNIAESFSTFARLNVSNIFVEAIVHENRYLVLRSLISDSQFDTIKVDVLPTNYTIVEPIFSDSVYDNTFYSPSNGAVLTAYPLGTQSNKGDSLRHDTTTSRILKSGKWLSYYYYNLEDAIRTDSGDPDNIDVIKTEKSIMFKLETIEHRKFDFDREQSYHTDVFDFELDAYRDWLISEVQSPAFLGKYTDLPTPSSSELSAYKVQLLEIIGRYFDSISLNRQMLLKEFDTNNFEGTIIDNEYNRLAENDNINLLSSNMINEHINKFSYDGGLDVYNRPYTLNLAFPFRYNNFAPSLGENLRNLRNATHSWLVIGEGIPPYFDTLKVNGVDALKTIDVKTEQPINILQRFYGDIGTTDEINEWGLTNSNLISGITDDIAIFEPQHSTNEIRRALTIREQSIGNEVSFNYSFVIKNTMNTNVNIKIELIDTDNNNKIYSEWFVNRNVLGGVDMVIDETKTFNYSDTVGNLMLRFKVVLGHTSVIELRDFNFYKSTLRLKVINPDINFDSDSISGMEKYIGDMITSYSSVAITKSDILSKTIDVYNNIRSHSIISDEDGAYTCFFRGVKVVMSSKYEGWKFSAILKTSTAPSKEDRSIELLENDTFKSITLLVNMYVPEPVLTSIEQPNKYWLDRSLLYFSDGNYATESSLSSFGRENISLKIHEPNSPKTYLGDIVTNNWYFERGGIDYIHVGKGILSRFNVDFTSFLDLTQDFTVFFGETNDVETINYGMEITFKNIQEVTTDYFWCTEIHVKIKETVSSVTNVIEYDMLAEFKANGEVFYEKNKMDIVEAILIENAEYERVLRNTSAINRFSLLSSSDIANWLKSNDVMVTNSDEEIHYENIGIVDPTINVGVVSLTSINKDIVNVPSKYTNTYVRQSGSYSPITKLLRPSSDIFELNYIDYGYSLKASNETIVNTIKTNNDREFESVWFYRKDNSNIDLSEHYRFYTNRKDYVTLNWYTNPIEYKHDVSLILSSEKVMVIEYVKDGENIDLYPYLKPYLFRLISNYGFNERDFTDSQKIEMISLMNKGVNTQTFSEYNFVDIILRRFYDSTFKDIYNVSKIEVDNTIIDFIEINDTSLSLNSSVPNGSLLKITLDRV